MTGKAAEPLGAVIIAAHNEAAVIARTLRALEALVAGGTARVVVACNGCTDDTAAIARGFTGVEVIELETASKVAALRAGDRVVGAMPRIYLDADIELTAVAAHAVLDALRREAIAGRPPHCFDSRHAGFAVRRWYAVRERLPSIANALWGAGCYALSVQGRARFDEFPDIVSDDLFIDALFSRDEITIVPTDPVIVRTPGRMADLMRILRRSYRTQREVEAAGTENAALVSSGQRGQLHDLARMLLRAPWRVVDVAIYIAVVSVARLRARGSAPVRWERDESSRQLTGESG